LVELFHILIKPDRWNCDAARNLSGLPGLWIQDAACQSGVMAIYDRTKENLCASDAGIVSARLLLLDTIENFKTKKTRPAGTDRPETYMVRAVSITLPKEKPWLEACTNHMCAVLGKDFGYEP